MSTEEQILKHAANIGFATAGIAEAEATHSFARYEEWIANNCAAGMDYLARHAELRRNPSALLPSIRSVIVVAAPYPVNTSPRTGFSTYARGTDYHVVLRDKLSTLATILRDEFGAEATRVCVDSAPILEREWAARAGIGWIGKQNQVVNPTIGCCFFLGLLLTDLKLTPSQPMDNQCGSCRKCLDACPTKAIDEEGFLHAQKCISYLTIEHKGDIPNELSPAVGEALFGCDLCTSICPFNPAESQKVLPEFTETTCPSPEQCLSMSEEEFQERFKNTPVHRTGLERLQRNALISIKNTGSK